MTPRGILTTSEVRGNRSKGQAEGWVGGAPGGEMETTSRAKRQRLSSPIVCMYHKSHVRTRVVPVK